MASKIETALYGDELAALVDEDGSVGDHCILELTQTQEHLRLRICRATYWHHVTEVLFPDPIALGVETLNHEDEDDLRMPWHIHGFHAWEVEPGAWGNPAPGLWDFKLHCYYIRWRWRSAWPVITTHEPNAPRTPTETSSAP